MAKAKTRWTPEGLVVTEEVEEPKRVARAERAEKAERSRKGGYVSERNLDLNRRQSIEDLTGSRIKKKS